MFDLLVSTVLPIVKELIWTACTVMLAYVLNKVSKQFNLQ